MSRHRMFTRGGDAGRRSTRTGMPRAREVASDPTRDPAGERPAPWGWRQRVALAFVVGGAFLAFLLALATRPGLPYRTDLIEHWSPDRPLHLGLGLRSGGAPMERAALAGGGWIHSVEIAELAPLPGDELRSVDFLVDVRAGDSQLGERPGKARFMHAELRDLDRGRILVSGDGTVARTEDLVEFRVPGGRKAADPGKADAAVAGGKPSRWRLEIQTRDDVSIALRCLVSPPTAEAGITNGGTMAIRIPVANSASVRWAYPHGRTTTWSDAPGMSRAGLIAALWERGSASWTFFWIVVAASMVGIGIACVPVGETARAGRLAGAAIGFLFGGFGLVHLLVTPPFMGIDEPSHVFSYHNWKGDADATHAAWELGYRTHFARMMMRPHQKFAPGDVGTKFWWFIDGPGTMDTHPALRSVLAARVWTATRGWVEGQPAGVGIWRLRWISLLAASAGIGIAGGLLARGGGGETRAPALGWWLLLVPSLPYFAMNVSNYPLLIGLWAVAGACIARMVNHATLPATTLGLFGLVFGLAVHTSVNALPMTVIVVAAMAGWFLGRENARQTTVAGEPSAVLGSRALAWLAFGVGMVVAHLASSAEYDEQLVRTIASKVPFLAGRGAWWIWLGLLGGCAVLALFEAAWAARAHRPGGASSVQWPALRVVAAMVVVGMAANLVMGPPHVPALQEAVPLWDFFPHQQRLLPSAILLQASDPNPPVGEYVSGVVRGFVGSWGPGAGDVMVSRFFWLENGYLDSLAPLWESRVLTTFFGLGIALLFWRLSSHPNRPRLVRSVAVIAGAVATAAAFAYAARVTTSTPSLHGRYLIGLYLCLLGTCFLGWKGIIVRWQTQRPMRLALWLVLPPVLLQAASLSVVFARYFGE